MKTLIGIIVLLALIAGGYIWYSSTDIASVESTPAATTNASATSTPEEAPQQPNTYTLAEVATHNSAASCWAAVNGSVYDLTSWIGKHPGGPDRILGLCGKDGTQMFMAMHATMERPQQMLATFRIGTLAE